MKPVIKTRLLLAVLFVAGCCTAAFGQKCLEYGPTVVLAGTVRSQVFAGPPNYESIRRGDRKETATILTLVTPTCMLGNDPAGFDVSEANIREMQLVIMKSDDWKTIRRRMGKRVVVTGTLFHAHTGHHRRKVLINVADIRVSSLPERQGQRGKRKGKDRQQTSQRTRPSRCHEVSTVRGSGWV